MRSSALALTILATLAPAAALAAPKPGVIWNRAPRPVKAPRGTAPSAFTSISHTIYMNPCLPNGCTIRPGFDDATVDASSIADSQVLLPAWKWGPDKWDTLVQCVKDTYAPFDIQITTVDPGTTPHSEIMIGGTSTDLNPMLSAGGVAPFLGCGTTDDNVISFVFANDVDPGSPAYLNFLCGAVAQETSHVYGLDHELDAADPMTYLELGSAKTFQDSNPRCGENLNQPRDCGCGGATQNSFRFLMDTFGPANLAPATIEFQSPTDGGWIRPGDAVRVKITNQLTVTSAGLAVDGAAGPTVGQGPFVFNLPTSTTGGAHQLTVTAQDTGNRTTTGSISVNVTASCASGATCADGTHCLGGFCLPGADVAGGLGAACTTNDACVTGSCGTDGTSMLCTGACDAGMTCPTGYTCLASSGAGVCWPAPAPVDDGGCATTGGNGGAALALLGFAALVLRRRR